MGVQLQSRPNASAWNRRRRTHSATLLTIVLALGFGLAPASSILMYKAQKGDLRLTSSAFKEGQAIPVRYTCDGNNTSPPLQWTGAPAGTKSLALIVDDPDAPGAIWVHWVVYDLPPTVTSLAEDAPKSESIAGKARQGTNDFKALGYGGPCPPFGKAHRYIFKLYALDTMLNLKPGASRREVELAMATHVIGQTQLIGTYQRR